MWKQPKFNHFYWEDDHVNLEWCNLCKLYHAQGDHSESRLLKESNDGREEMVEEQPQPAHQLQ